MDEIDEGMRQYFARVNFGREMRLRALGEDEQVRAMLLTNIRVIKDFAGYTDGWEEADDQLVSDGRDDSLPVEGK